MVQVAGTILLTKSRIASLHWLLIHVRSDFKVLVMRYMILNGHALYLSDLFKPKFQNIGLLSVPRVKKKSTGCRALSSDLEPVTIVRDGSFSVSMNVQYSPCGPANEITINFLKTTASLQPSVCFALCASLPFPPSVSPHFLPHPLF